MEYKVAYDGPAHAMVTARPDDLHRAVTNLVENAVKYGGEIAIRLPLPPNGTASAREITLSSQPRPIPPYSQSRCTDAYLARSASGHGGTYALHKFREEKQCQICGILY